MDFDSSMKSHTYKIILFSTLICGFIAFSHYETVFASILIVESENLPFETWQDIVESDKYVMVPKGTSLYDMFEDAPEGSAMKKILDNDKVKDLKVYGYKGSIPFILDDTHFAFDDIDLYKEFKEFPCQISALKTDELM